jgi:hypothetical protein
MKKQFFARTLTALLFLSFLTVGCKKSDSSSPNSPNGGNGAAKGTVVLDGVSHNLTGGYWLGAYGTDIDDYVYTSLEADDFNYEVQFRFIRQTAFPTGTFTYKAEVHATSGFNTKTNFQGGAIGTTVRITGGTVTVTDKGSGVYQYTASLETTAGDATVNYTGPVTERK